MVGNELLMQFQADILDVPVIRPKVAETTALGAAYAAGLAVGFWAEVEDLRANWAKDKEWTPKLDAASARSSTASGRRRSLVRSTGSSTDLGPLPGSDRPPSQRRRLAARTRAAGAI